LKSANTFEVVIGREFAAHRGNRLDYFTIVGTALNVWQLSWLQAASCWLSLESKPTWNKLPPTRLLRHCVPT